MVIILKRLLHHVLIVSTPKNEYPDLGGNYDVIHHTQFINYLIKENKITIVGGSFKGKNNFS